MKKRRRSKRKMRKMLLAALSLFVVAVAAVVLVLALQVPEVTFSDPLRFAVGTELVLSDVVEDVRYGNLVEPDMPLDSSEKGLIKFTFTLENLFKIESEKEIMIDFYQSEKTDEAEKSDPILKPTEEEKDNNADNNNNVDNKDNTDNKNNVDNKNNTDNKNNAKEEKPGESTMPSPFDENGKLVDGVYSTSNGKVLEIKNGLATVEGILIANKSYSLPKSYTAPYLLPEAEQAYYKLRDAAKQAGFALPIKSAYRSWNDQNYIFNGYVRDDGLENALTYSARPGHSEHQTGLAMDLLTASTVESKTEKFKSTLDWLADNAHEYGFILRYPNEKSHITGYIYEPWHYRYVGTELAQVLYNGGDWITLEEHFGIDSVYRVK